MLENQILPERKRFQTYQSLLVPIELGLDLEFQLASGKMMSAADDGGILLGDKRQNLRKSGRMSINKG